MKISPSQTDRLHTQYQAIENILATVVTSRLLTRPKPDKWNIHDNIAHLARYQVVFIDRINQILLKENPPFGRYIAEEDPEFENWRPLDIDALIAQMDVDRKIIYDLIKNLTGSQLSRIGTHKKFGALDVVQWTEFFLLHEAHHIYTIFQLAYDTELQ